MSTYFKDVPGYIKFIAVIDRENNPVLFFNFHAPTTELSYQLAVFASLDLFKNKNESVNDNTTASTTSTTVTAVTGVTSLNDEYKGLLMPLYEYEEDLGVYGYVGNNGMKICVIKKLEKENGASETKMQVICKEIYMKHNKLLLNPFYDKNEFNNVNSVQREQFSLSVLDYITQNQIL